MTEEMEMICFQVISSAGGAKSNYISAIQAAKEGRFDDARTMIKQMGGSKSKGKMRRLMRSLPQ